MSRRTGARGERRRSAGLRPLRKLPSGTLGGRFLFSGGAIAAAERLLPTYRGPDGDHEGIVFLLGRELDDLTVFTSALAPVAEHSLGRVVCGTESVSAAQGAARARHLGILAQVHSHPGALTEHSEGDDELVLMPFEGMLSLVVPHYGRFGMRPLANLGVHQYQSGRWVSIDAHSAAEGLIEVPVEVDLR
jgi:proteasome lid subunit RPN8/RPN11